MKRFGAFRASLCRIADLDRAVLSPLDRSEWAAGDYVLGEVISAGSSIARIELESGRMIDVMPGDGVIGAFGVRAATLEATGSWSEIGADGRMTAMTGAGLFGRITSVSPFLGGLVELRYRGHLLLDGRKATMAAMVPPTAPLPFETPVILIVGSSMSAGKTATGRILVRRLKAMGKRVIAAKLTGAGRYRDVLQMGDAGADHIFDFTDAGLPSTVCGADEYRAAMGGLLSRMAALSADVVVVEAGASPLEPYNGDVVVEMLRANLRLTVLCASDPYAVVGIRHAFGMSPDLVAGVATNTDAGQALVRRLTGLPAMRLIDPAVLPELDRLLERALAGAPGAAPAG